MLLNSCHPSTHIYHLLGMTLSVNAVLIDYDHKKSWTCAMQKRFAEREVP